MYLPSIQGSQPYVPAGTPEAPSCSPGWAWSGHAATPMVQEKKEWKNLTNLTWTFALSMVHGPFNSSPALAPIHPPSLILSFSPLSLSLSSLSFFSSPSLTQHSSAFPSFGVLRLIAGCPSFLKKSLTGSSWTLFSLLRLSYFLLFTYIWRVLVVRFLSFYYCTAAIPPTYPHTPPPRESYGKRHKRGKKKKLNIKKKKRKEKKPPVAINRCHPSSSICCAKNKESKSDGDRIHSPYLIADAPFRSSISHSFYRFSPVIFSCGGCPRSSISFALDILETLP